MPAHLRKARKEQISRLLWGANKSLAIEMQIFMDVFGEAERKKWLELYRFRERSSSKNTTDADFSMEVMTLSSPNR
ncbi:MAG: hypothetical protein IK079_04260 [Desulfovibrio sp.]|nr:hypothetical protein [Desulfovibrio sp.]